jgi:hypothetical protein
MISPLVSKVNPSHLADFAALRRPPMGKKDAEVNHLLDLDTRREVSLSIVPIWHRSENLLPAPKEAPALGLETIPLSEREVEYPTMLEMHAASSLESDEEVARWREKHSVSAFSPDSGEEVLLQCLPKKNKPGTRLSK